jgi:hypothetical protein
MRRWIYVVVLCVANMSAYAQVDADIDSLLQRPFVKAEFKKERKLKVLSKPFVTFGYMLFKPDKGLIWKTTRPIDDTILIRGTEITPLNDQAKQTALPASNPIMASASEMFLAIMSRNKAKILTIFEYEKQPAINGKTIYKLIPKDEKLSAIISAINISGKERVEVIEILEKSGDSTSIHLLNEVFDASKLDSVEQSLYERI